MPEQELALFKSVTSMFSPAKGVVRYRRFDLHMMEGGFFASTEDETSRGIHDWVSGISAPYGDVESIRLKELGTGYIALFKWKIGKHFWQFRRVPIMFTNEQVGELRKLVSTVRILSERIEFQ